MKHPLFLCHRRVRRFLTAVETPPVSLSSVGSSFSHSSKTCKVLYTVLAWWQYNCQWCRTHGLQLAGITLSWLVGLNIHGDCLVPYCIMWPAVGIPTVFQTPVTVPLRSPNGRQMPAVRAVQGDCERVYKPCGVCSLLFVHWIDHDPEGDPILYFRGWFLS